MNKNLFLKIQKSQALAGIVSLLAGITYFVQAWIYAHTQTSLVDEGGYQYIGYHLVQGDFQPFQNYGPVQSWYAPFAYLIPGLIQKWFGPSLRTGRYFSIFLGLMMLIALWLTARKLGGKWWGAAAVWAVALSPVVIQMYSLADSQVLVICLLAWCLWFSLGDDRRLWQVVIGSVLAGIIAMTRLSMISLLPLLIIYIFWQRGTRIGLWVLGGSLLPILILHVLYWPNILQLWANWIPPRLFPFIDAYRFPAAAIPWQLGKTLANAVSSFFQSFRFQYLVMAGAVMVLFLWPHKVEWKNQSQKRTAFFLAGLFFSMLLLHGWASFSPSVMASCIYCFTPYIAFFNIASLLLVIVILSSNRKKLSLASQIGIVLLVIFLSLGIGYANFEKFGTWLLSIRFPAVNRGLNPQLWFPGFTIYEFLWNKYGAEYNPVREYTPVVAGLIISLFLIAVTGLCHRFLVRKKYLQNYPFGQFLITIVLALGYILSPIMGGNFRENGTCNADILEIYDRTGERLAQTIPPGSQVYWESDLTALLLYTADIKIYPAQIYAGSSFRTGGDPEQLRKFGLWNETLAQQWRSEADVIVSEPVSFLNPFIAPIDINQFDAVKTESLNPCEDDRFLIIYLRKR